MKTTETLLKSISDLKWLPFIGDNFNQGANGKKILVIGESHYHSNTAESIAKHEKDSFTNLVLEDSGINRNYYTTKMFPNFHKALIGNDHFDSKKFWNSLAFYNIVQRSMNTNKGRPNYSDFKLGWEVFFEVVDTIKPNICIFIGTTSSKFLADSIKESKIKVDLKEFDYLPKVGRTYPRKGLININNHNIEMHFIQHCSQYFSWSRWNQHLKGVIPNEIKELERITARKKTA